MSKHDTTALRWKMLAMLKEDIGPLVCPGCATEAMVCLIASFMNCAISIGDTALAEATAIALEDIAGHCRRMEPIQDRAAHVASTRTH